MDAPTARPLIPPKPTLKKLQEAARWKNFVADLKKVAAFIHRLAPQ
jgi:hypothetical protein